jgi:glycosyltransferase involved in cell wall biosynthesis
MAEPRPVLSLIIPTRERAGTLVHTLATALEQRSDDYEVVVSDNASADNTRQVVESFDDPRIRYINTASRLSMCGNYEFAVEHARGDYVLIIGDDDAVIPGKLDFLLEKLREAPEPLIHTWPLHIYDWPVSGAPARLTYRAGTGAPYEIDLRARARFAMTMGGWKYYELPSPYHSAVPRSILDALRQRTGKIFHSTQPDVFTAMAIPAFAERAINLNQPISFNGRSARSNGLGFIAKSAVANIERFILEYGDYRFHPSLYTGVTGQANMIPDAILVARDMFPEIYDGAEFGYGPMWAYVCRLRFASHWEVLRKRRLISQAHPFSVGRFMFYSVIHEASALRRTLLNRVAAKGGLGAAIPDNIHDFSRLLA